MKKWLFLVVACVFSFGVQAKPSSCGYKDYFHLSDKSHPEIYIVGGNSDMDVILQFISPRSFLLLDNIRCQSGYAHVTVAYNSDNWCILDIKDGPWMMHPTVSAACKGIQYLGTNYDGIGTFSYTIELD